MMVSILAKRDKLMMIPGFISVHSYKIT